VLDVGCGMGGLSNFLLSKGINVEALTPDRNQIDYIERLELGPVCHHSRFEDFRTENKYGTVINAESLQYLPLEETFRKVDHIILPEGRWIITDVFRRYEKSSNKSGHRIIDLLCKVKEHGWKIVYERDITPNVLPTLKLIHMYVDRYLIPLSHYAEEKFTYKKAWLFYLTKNIRHDISVKSKKEVLAIQPELFVAEKKYMLYVLQKDRLSS
jgi:2-polyprenyl-3-methyl-5-hydroxy-6-metoxy-1,4-benzoquinol methylase